MDSYEMDEDLSEPQSRYSSKLSLQEKKSSADSSLEFGPKSIAVPLNHSAAHHRVAVKPKRTHGVPRRRKGQQLSSALPATPELNEDSSVRSISPVVSQKDDVADPDTLLCVSTEAPTETQIKCSSLPAGLRSNPPWSSEGVVQLNRSLSSAGPREEQPSTDKTDEKPTASLFDRIFPRKSGRKKKDKVKEEKQTVTQEGNRVQEVIHAKDEVSEIVRTRTQSSYTHTSINITSHTETNQYSGPASRQRLPPVDIPLSPSHAKKEFALPRVPVEKRLEKTGSSPIHIELENRFKQKQISLTPTSSPTEPSPHKLGHIKPPPSPILPKPNLEDAHHRLSSTSKTTRNEELRSKMKLPGLSALQQRVLLLNDQVDNGFSSLTHFPAASKPLVKSQSFKCPKVDSSEERNRNLKRTAEFLDEERKAESGTSFVKAASLDCVKNLDELKRPKVEKSENWAEDCDNVRVKRIEFKKPKRKSKEDKVETEPEVFSNSGVTISGPSHTAVVNVTSIDKNENISNETSSHALSVKEHQVSVTKIHLKHEVMHTSNQNVAVTSKDGIPELGGKQLSKIDLTPTNNLIPSAKLPKSAEEQKSTFNFDTSPDVAIKPPTPRKFSKENLEIVEKEHQEVPDSPTPVVSSATINLQQPTKYKKNNKVYRKSSATLAEFQSNEKGCLKNKSVSLDSLKSEEDKKRNSTGEPVVLRKKSIAAKKEEEPELMKVFARRSLKLKDSEVSSIQETLLADIRTRESDKENQVVEEPKKVSVRTDDAEEEDSTVMYRKVLHNFGQRAVSVNVVLKKQKSEEERRKTEQWKTEDEKLTEDRFFSSKSELIDETKNFRQRKAEWEKRAQLAQMKKTP